MGRKKLYIEPGVRYSYLTTVREATREESTSKGTQWICVCDCGRETLKTSNRLLSGVAKSCGCKGGARSKTEVAVGVKYNQLTTIREATREEKKFAWLCICDCGKETLVRTGDLVSGRKKSCGCQLVKHGGYKTLTYSRWQSMLARCYSPSQKDRLYQKQNITVCDKWRRDYGAFHKDMGECPSKTHTLDRIDNNKGYEPGNCRWATSKEQNRNRTNNKYINGDLIVSLEEQHGISRHTLYHRAKVGMGEKLLLTNSDLRANKRKLSPEQVKDIRNRRSQGEMYKDIAADYSVSATTIADIATHKLYKDVT